MSDISNSADIIDVRDIIARFEELREESVDDDGNQLTLDDADAEAFTVMGELLNDMKGYGGDEQWEGDWYPITLIRDSYFVTYAQEFADDMGLFNTTMDWPLSCIDWNQAARELQIDYTSVEYDGITYWYR